MKAGRKKSNLNLHNKTFMIGDQEQAILRELSAESGGYISESELIRRAIRQLTEYKTI